jgi:hypothetical protein
VSQMKITIYILRDDVYFRNTGYRQLHLSMPNHGHTVFYIGATKITNWLGSEELIPKDLKTKLRAVGET